MRWTTNENYITRKQDNALHSIEDRRHVQENYGRNLPLPLEEKVSLTILTTSNHYLSRAAEPDA